MNLDLSQLEPGDYREFNLFDLAVFGQIAESEDKRLTAEEISVANGKPARLLGGNRTWHYKRTLQSLNKLWRKGYLRRLERRKLSRWRKTRKVGALQEHAYWCLSEEGWLLMSRLKCWAPETIEAWREVKDDLNEDYIGD